MVFQFGQTGLTRIKAGLGVTYLVILILLTLLSLFFYETQKKNIENEINSNLHTIAKLKMVQLSDWYLDELNDANLIAHSPFMIEKIDRWLQSGSESDHNVLLSLFDQIVAEHDYKSMILISQQGNFLGSSDDNLHEINSHLIDLARQSIETDSTLSTDLYFCSIHHEDQIDFISPVFLPQSKKTVAVVFRMLPEYYIYPLLSYWPDPNLQGENNLVRRELKQIVVLNQQNDLTPSPSFLQIDPKDSTNPSFHVLKGETGIIEGIDYLGHEVHAYIDSVKATNWFLISKINKDEIRNQYQRIGLITLIVYLLIAMTIGTGMVMLYYLQQKNHYRNLWNMEEEYKTTLYSIGDGVITTDKNGLICQMNPVAEKLTGWKEAEARNKVLEDVFRIVSEDSGLMIENPVFCVMQKGAVVGLANHTLLISKEEIRIPIADSGAPIYDKDGQLRGVVLVFRDQTEERDRQKALEESQRQLSTLMSNLPGIAYRCRNDIDWTMEFVSQGCFDLTGFTSGELIGNKLVSYGELIVPSFRTTVDQTIQTAIGNKTWFQLEYQIKTREGQIKWIWEKGLGIFSSEGQLIALEGFISDITSRKLAEEEKLQFANILEASMNELYIFNSHDYRFIYANQGALTNLGYSLSDLKTMTPLDIKPQIPKVYFTQIISPLINGLQDKVIFETIHQRKDGSQYPVEINLQLLENQNEHLFLAVGIDITERKKNETALRQSEEEYRNLFDNHSAVKLLLNQHTQIIINANQAAIRFYGYNKKQLIGMRFSDLNTFPETNLSVYFEQIITNQNNHFEISQRLSNQQIRDVEVFASPVKFRGQQLIHAIVHDVSERKSAERRIKLLSRSIEQSPVCVMITDLQGQIEYVNNEFTEVTGYSLLEILGKNPRILKSGLHNQALYAQLWSTILSGNTWQGELYNKKKNGEFYWESASIVPISDENNLITHFVALGEDITEKKKMLEELINAKQRAEESERLKSAFLANMSHEIRTPLNSILGFTSFLTNSENLSPKEKETYAEIINKSAEGLLQIINDILDISRLETGQVKVNKKDIDLELTLEQIYKQTANRLERLHKSKEIELELVGLSLATTICQDEYKLVQIFLNLLYNALKFTPKGSIRFGIEETDSQLIRFFVSDTGIGIKPENQTTIFERFRQIDDKNTRALGGNGLGLAIVKNLVDLLGGSITLESEYGVGSTFRFTLPC